MRRKNLFVRQALASVLIFLLSACAEEPFGGNDQTGDGHTVTLRLSASMIPIPETKATAIPACAGSEAEAAGFKYEMVSSDAVAKTPGFNVEMESTPAEGIVISLGTRAPATLKNVYALLFTSDGAFNGRADIGTATSGAGMDITFTNVTTPAASNCRLVMVANDNAAVTDYESTGGTGNFASFSGNYAAFQALIITSAINQDVDVPYAGSARVSLSQSETGATVEILLYRTLVKVTFNNHTFDITGGPERSSITLYNAGVRRFATLGEDDYEGTGTTLTTDFVVQTAGSNDNSVSWYVGENIQSPITSIQTPADRNSRKAPKNACYIRVASEALPIAGNTSLKIGDIVSGTKSFTYDYYLGRSSDVTDFALRRHTNYILNSEISGTLAGQEELAAEDGRVTLTKREGESAGLAIGMFGGASGYTIGTGDGPTISGSYTRLLLLEPNTTRTTVTDNVSRKWSANFTTLFQPETRKYWDPTYTLNNIDKTAGFAYDYCDTLTLGGVGKGTWYLPTHAQLSVMWTVFRGLQGNSSFANYSAFNANYYRSSTENDRYGAMLVGFMNGNLDATHGKTTTLWVRCVRDATSSLSAQMVTTVDGYPVIDISALGPLGCVLSSSEAVTRRTAMYAPGVTPSNSALLSVGLDVSGPNGLWNANMSTTYQVMKQEHSVGATDFMTAWNACKEYAGEGGSKGTWRLPTQRELEMIYILHPQLIGEGSFNAFSTSNYWTATECSATSGWAMRFSDVYIRCHDKSSTAWVRCVKDF